MFIWVMWVTLASGQVIDAGQYQSQDRCIRAIEMQRPYWQKRHATDMKCLLFGDGDASRRRT